MSERSFTNDIVVSSRIRLARNIKGMPFPSRANDEDAMRSAITSIDAVMDGAPKEAQFHYVNLDRLTDYQRISFVEKHLISPELGKYPHSGTVLNKEETLSIMINEEDHVRIQCILPGFSLEEAYRQADGMDDIMQESVTFAFSEKYGYLTCCPTNVGTGMRAGVMLHVPALVLRAQLSGIVTMANKFGLAIRGIYGEGSSALGDLFQISNQNSLGQTEEEIVANVHTVAKEIIKKEREERNALLIHNEDELKDRIQRAYGILTNAHMISTQEAMKLLSLLRMGTDINLLQEVNASTINTLMVNIQPATLSLIYNTETNEKQRDIFRAQYIRDYLTK